MSGGNTAVRYTGREPEVGDRRDNLARPTMVTLDAALQLALENLARVRSGTQALREWIEGKDLGGGYCEAAHPSWEADLVLDALDALPPGCGPDREWAALMAVRDDIARQRRGQGS